MSTQNLIKYLACSVKSLVTISYLNSLKMLSYLQFYRNYLKFIIFLTNPLSVFFVTFIRGRIFQFLNVLLFMFLPLLNSLHISYQYLSSRQLHRLPAVQNTVMSVLAHSYSCLLYTSRCV